MRKVVFLVALGLMAWAAVAVPLPLLAVMPGDALAVPPRVDFGEAEEADELTGKLLLTTVRIGRPSSVGAAVAWLDGETDLLMRQQVIPPGVDRDEYVELQQRLFEESAQVAAAVGLRAAGRDVEVGGNGARVEIVMPGGPAGDVLRTGDVIIALDGQPVEVAADLVAASRQLEAGQTAEVTIRRGDERKTVDVEVQRFPELDRPALGVAVRTVDLKISLPFEVDVERGRLGGPSAGLMLALTVFDLADPGDLLRDRVVAGTGTIDLSGRVGPVGGVHQKVEAAKDADAAVFLVPTQEAGEARENAGADLEVIAVDTLEQAISTLTSSEHA